MDKSILLILAVVGGVAVSVLISNRQRTSSAPTTQSGNGDMVSQLTNSIRKISPIYALPPIMILVSLFFAAEGDKADFVLKAIPATLLFFFTAMCYFNAVKEVRVYNRNSVKSATWIVTGVVSTVCMIMYLAQ